MTPDLSKKVDVEGKPMLDPFGKQVDPLGFIGETSLGHSLRPESLSGHWLSLIGVIGIIMSFGHSILAMSGEETLAQVYREVESPKLKNFKRARPGRLPVQHAVHVAHQFIRRDDHP